MKVFGTVDTFIEGPVHDLRLGRLVANAQFLLALIRHGHFDAYHLYCPTAAHVRMLEEALSRELGAVAGQRRISLSTHLHLPQHLQEIDFSAFHVGGWGRYLPRLAHLRSKICSGTDRRAFPLTGITHSLHTGDIFPKMREMVSAPFGPCDAVVCTSDGAQQVMQRHWDLARGRARDEGISLVAQGLRFPRIPLAVEEAAFDIPERQLSRRAIGLPPDDVVILYLGRLSPHTKADLQPLLYTHSRLVKDRRSRARLVIAGGGESEYQQSLMELARELGIGDCVTVSTNVSDQQKRLLLSAADIFVSPVDNHQETFGLTVVEAMAAGLPVVASDFDGYRDLVEEGVTGFRVPTTAGHLPDHVIDLVGLLDFNLNAFLMAETIAVDTEALEDRLARLIDAPSLRQTLGAAGRARARRFFTWAGVIGSYERLWDELAAAAAEFTPVSAPDDPYVGDLHEIFAGYPTRTLGVVDRLRLSPLGTDVLAGRVPPPELHHDLLPLIDPEMGTFVLRLCGARAGVSLAEVSVEVDKQFGIAPAHTAFQVIWLLKHGLLARAS